MDETLKRQALDYHRYPKPGKLAIQPTKPLSSQHDLALAYSPGVAAACEAIVDDPLEADRLTARGNLVAVVSNGTAVLGLGNIGPLAAKPVMEGKAVLFKKFAGIDVFDLEIKETDPDRLIDIIASLEPSFGAIHLEDIKAPECFYIEQQLRARMKVPVFHDDQHGTAIIVGAAMLNGLIVVGKKISDLRLVVNGAGAAAIACMDLLVLLGARRENILVCDRQGVIHDQRTDLTPEKARYARQTTARTLAEALVGADAFLGVSSARTLTADMIAPMAAKPLIFALANPEPEILPPLAMAARPDAIVATGRSDYPNQVNNVLCFPFLFRGALDVGATTINEEMKLACVHALAELAQAEPPALVREAYGGQEFHFGRDYLIPKPLDPRLILIVAPAVAKAAMDSGVATRPIHDWTAYRDQLQEFVYRSSLFMRPVYLTARKEPKRITYCEGEDERVLQAVQMVVQEGIARPILIGRPAVIEMRLKKLGIDLKAGVDFDITNPESDPRFREYWTQYHQLMQRKGVFPEQARRDVMRHSTLIGALMLSRSETQGLICGTYGFYENHLRFIANIIGHRTPGQVFGAMNGLMLPRGNLFIADTYVNADPDAEQLAQITLMAAATVRRFGIEPRVALVSHSSFGNSNRPSAVKMREALALITARAPDLQVEGEMQGDAALSEEVRNIVFPNARIRGAANLLILPTQDAANIAFNLLKIAGGDNVTIGPILLGAAAPVHILTPTATVRRIVDMTALTVAESACLAPQRAVEQ